MAEKFISHLKVDKKIVSLLSKSTYQRSFSYTVRELISNAYDADALSVYIKFDSDFTYVEIEDDGNGMTKLEFEKYLTIAGTKQETDLTRKYKRKRIGQFGVGFLSIFPFCESLEITTSTENSSEILRATIPTKEYFESATTNQQKSENVENIPIAGTINNNIGEKLKHYTKIKLTNPTQLVKQYFTRPETKKRETIFARDPVDRFKWELKEDLPIALPSNSKYFSDFNYEEPIGLNVYINGEELFRNDYAEYILDKGVKKFGDITCKYIFTSNFKSIIPLEARGIKMRVNNVGIGPRTDFSLKRDRGFSRLHWITGEIFFSEQIKEYLNISRDGFISNPKFDEIQDFFAHKLREIANEVEIVAVAERDIQNISSLTRSNASKPKDEIIADSLRKLENKGFSVVKTKENGDNGTVTIDKKSKTVYVSKSAANYQEILDIFGEKIEIKYDKWNLNSDYPACRRISVNIIEINQNYPLFKSKSLGNVFKRIHIMLLIAKEDTSTSDQLFSFLNRHFISEFKDFI